VRLLTALCKKLKTQFFQRDLANPSSFFAQLFRKGGQTELNHEAIQANHYTWYRPSNTQLQQVQKLTTILDQLTIFEVHDLILKSVAVLQLKRGPEGPSQHTVCLLYGEY
jgi:hypothetical protein